MNRNFELIQTLSSKEFSRFSDFVNSPFYNKRSDLIKLLRYLRSIYPLLNENNLSDEVIYSKVYKSGEVNKQVIRNLMTRLGELLGKYFTVTGLDIDEHLQFMPHAAMLVEKNRKGELSKLIMKHLPLIENEPSELGYLKKKLEYLEARNEFLSDANKYKEKSAAIRHVLDDSLKFYILSLLRNANELAAFQYVYRDEMAELLLNKIFNVINVERYLEQLSTEGSKYYNMTAIYYYGLLSKIDDPDGSIREKLKDIVYNSFGKLKLNDLMECWSLLYASYIFSMTAVTNKTNTNANKEVHKINTIFVDNELIPVDKSGFINENTYHNIAMQAIIARDFNWVEEFLNDYKDRLRNEIKESIYSFCMSLLNFSKGEFEKCISQLSRIRADEINTEMFIRTTYIKCYYELGYFDQAESAVNALRTFLSQKKGMTHEIKRALPAFIKYSKLLLKLKSTGKKISDEILLKAKMEPDLSSRAWLIEKLKELM